MSVRQVADAVRKGCKPTSGRCGVRSIALHHETIEERRELRMRVEGKNMCDVLVRSHDDDATLLSIDPAKREDVMAALQIGTERLLIIDQAVAPFPRQQESRHALHDQLTVILLKDGPDIDDRVDVL